MARILVIDDDQDSRDLVGYILKREGHNIIEAEDGLTALNLLQCDHNFDLIISNLRMPNMDGASLLRQLRGLCLHIPAILVSAQWHCELFRVARESGANSYLQKPFVPKQLTDLVHRVTM